MTDLKNEAARHINEHVGREVLPVKYTPKIYGFAPANERPYFIAAYGSSPDADYVLHSDYKIIEQRLSDADKRIAGLEEALKPFARFFCSPVGTCACHNCVARDLLEQALQGAVK